MTPAGGGNGGGREGTERGGQAERVGRGRYNRSSPAAADHRAAAPPAPSLLGRPQFLPPSGVVFQVVVWPPLLPPAAVWASGRHLELAYPIYDRNWDTVDDFLGWGRRFVQGRLMSPAGLLRVSHRRCTA